MMTINSESEASPTIRSSKEEQQDSGRGSKITPCLWFDTQAEEAAKLYTSIFPDSSIHHISRYSDAGSQVSGQPAGSVMTVTFTIAGQDFMGLNGGPAFQFSPAVSFIINCNSQDEIDYYWNKLLNGGAPQQCGWLTDKFGVSWQIVPTELEQMMQNSDSKKSERVMASLLQMVKLDLEALRKAYE